LSAIANILKQYLYLPIYSVCGSHGLSIIVFTVIFKVLLLPLTISQTRSTIKTQALQPKVLELQSRYKSDPQRLQAEQSKLYKESGVNPLAGCLPLLIQMPILWAVFYVFRDVALFGQETFLGLMLAGKASQSGIIGIIFALISGGSTFLSTYLLTPRDMNKDGKKDDVPKNPMSSNSTNLIMSVFFGYISYTMPGGLVIYWVINNILQLIIQYFLNKQIKRQMAAEVKY
jgi:YidC/Oxa1 family membrane protein insertase